MLGGQNRNLGVGIWKYISNKVNPKRIFTVQQQDLEVFIVDKAGNNIYGKTPMTNSHGSLGSLYIIYCGLTWSIRHWNILGIKIFETSQPSFDDRSIGNKIFNPFKGIGLQGYLRVSHYLAELISGPLEASGPNYKII